MDSTHVILASLLVIGIAIPVVGFWAMFRRQEKDEAVDAATFLALRELRDWLERTRAGRTN
jgi:hypothetical protein